MAQRLYLVRGIPGSGKTTLAKAIADATKASHWETDRFFYQCGGYLFNPKKLKVAHSWCQTMVEIDLAAGMSVVVSNTFVKRWELTAYYDIARKINSGIEIIEIVCKGEWPNKHNVPEEVVRRMRESWED